MIGEELNMTPKELKMIKTLFRVIRDRAEETGDKVIARNAEAGLEIIKKSIKKENDRGSFNPVEGGR